MKLVRTLFAVALAMSVAPLAACGKASDLAPLEHEANGRLKQFEHHLARLQTRRQDLAARKDKIVGLAREGAGKLQNEFDSAVTRLDALQRGLNEAKSEIAKFGKDPKHREALISATGRHKRELGQGITIVTGAFDAYEAYLMRVESKRDAVASAPPATEPTTPPPADTPAPGAATPKDPNTTSPPSPSGDMPPSSSTQPVPGKKAAGGGT